MPQGLLPKIDVTELEDNASCYTIGTNTIYAYSNNNRVRTEYHIINDKIFLYYRNNYNYSYDISSYHCYSYNDIKNINASYQYISLFYYIVAVVVAIVLLYVPYKILVYPFWRRL